MSIGASCAKKCTILVVLFYYPISYGNIDMKNMFEKGLVAVIITSLILAGACGDNSPKTAVKTFCKSVKSYDFESINKCVDGDCGFERTSGIFYDYAKDCVEKLKYQITDCKIKEESAIVKAELTYLDASGVMSRALNECILQITLSKGTDMGKLLKESLQKAVQYLNPEEKTAECEFCLIKKDGKWILTDIPEEFISVITAGFDSVKALATKWVE